MFRRAAAVLSLAVPAIVTGAASYLAFAPERSGTLAFWLLLCGSLGALGVGALAWGVREALAREWLTPRAGDFTRGWVGAALLYLAAWAFARTFARVGSPRGLWLVSLYAQLGEPRDLQAHAVAVTIAIGSVAAAEEIVWRGMVTQLLADRLGSRWAWVWAAGLYTVANAPTAMALSGRAGLNPLLVLAAAGGGLLWGAMARRYGRLVPGIVAHALFDSAIVILFPLWGGWVR